MHALPVIRATLGAAVHHAAAAGTVEARARANPHRRSARPTAQGAFVRRLAGPPRGVTPRSARSVRRTTPITTVRSTVTVTGTGTGGSPSGRRRRGRGGRGGLGASSGSEGVALTAAAAALLPPARQPHDAVARPSTCVVQRQHGHALHDEGSRTRGGLREGNAEQTQGLDSWVHSTTVGRAKLQ